MAKIHYSVFTLAILIVFSIVSIEPILHTQPVQADSSEPELHISTQNSSTWIRNSLDRPLTQYRLFIAVWNSGNATAYSVDVAFSVWKYGYVIDNGSISVGNMGKWESWNTTKAFELNDGYYYINLTLETPGRIWQTRC
jgi:hypothetical protein